MAQRVPGWTTGRAPGLRCGDAKGHWQACQRSLWVRAAGRAPRGGGVWWVWPEQWRNVNRDSGECRGGRSWISQARSPGCILSVGLPLKCWKHLEECICSALGPHPSGGRARANLRCHVHSFPFAQPRGGVTHISCNQLVYSRVMLEGFSVVSISPWLGSAAGSAQTQVWAMRPALGGPWRSRHSHHLATCPCDDSRCV